MTYLRERAYPLHIDKDSKSLYRGTPVAHPTIMAKTEVLRKYQYNTTVSSNEDIDLWFRLLADGYEIENIDEPLVKYRITENFFLRRSFRKAVNELKIYWRNLVRLHGFSPFLIYPIVRFFLRLQPSWIIRKLYFSRIRMKVIEKTD
jgi:hypothetical protein